MEYVYDTRYRVPILLLAGSRGLSLELDVLPVHLTHICFSYSRSNAVQCDIWLHRYIHRCPMIPLEFNLPHSSMREIVAWVAFDRL